MNILYVQSTINHLRWICYTYKYINSFVFVGYNLWPASLSVVIQCIMCGAMYYKNIEHTCFLFCWLHASMKYSCFQERCCLHWWHWVMPDCSDCETLIVTYRIFKTSHTEYQSRDSVNYKNYKHQVSSSPSMHAVFNNQRVALTTGTRCRLVHRFIFIRR